jgi:hypothetical protein
MSKVLQYVIMRKDLLPSKKSSGAFSLGANIAQACHAATAALVRFQSTPEAFEFVQSLEDMTVCVLGCDNEDELRTIEKNFEIHKINYHVWIEKPELIPTAIATAPVKKEDVFPLVSHLKLLR